MGALENRSFEKPDETRNFDKGRLDLITMGDVTMGRAVFQPGWRWSESMKPIVGTESCQVPHTGYIVSGHMHIAMDDGTEGDLGEGEMFVIAPGHDAWVNGSEPCVALDIQGAVHYAEHAG